MDGMADYKLSIIIPCFNEKGNIEAIINNVLKAPVKNKEIIIVDDKSTDGTDEILEKKIRPLVSQIIYHKIIREKVELYVRDSNMLLEIS
mgnify:CR=1 FL=1